MKLSQDLQISLTVAVTEASRLGHEYAGTEHLLYALALDRETAAVLRHAGADLARLKERLLAYLSDELERKAASSGTEPRLSLALQRVLTRAGMQVEGSGREEVRGSDLLVALFAEPGSYAVELLAEAGVSRLDVVSFLAHGVSHLAPTSPVRRVPAGEPGDEDAVSVDGDEALSAFTQELTELARRGRLDPLIGRGREIERALHILQRRRKNNPLFVGDAGVGKTALVEGLATKIAAGEVPEAFRQARIFRLDLGAMLAGTRYRGDFENRFKAVLGALEAIAQPVLFIDEIHTVVGAGSAGRGTLDASDLLKPALAEGHLRAIGATTWEEYRQAFQRDSALARRFQKVEVTEPSVEETARIFAGLQTRYEEHHGVRYSRAAVRAAAELAGRYLRDRKLPDKALDLLDEAGSAAALRGAARVNTPDVERVLAGMAGIPVRQVRGSERDRLARLEDDLKKVIFGQAEAIERLAAAIRTARAGLREPQKPVGAFLLTGPTGVGKTELARQLARVMGVELLRFDMSEYAERHTVSRLVGAPPGYVGFDRGGLLTEAVAKNPHAVLLLDEIEKAHPEVFSILLQVMDHGTLTDTNGKPTDFRHVILLMTSNVGARELARRAPGYGEEAAGNRDSDSDRAVEQLFSPEFRNRLDAQLRFAQLDAGVMERIVDKMVAELAAQVAARRVAVEITPEARRLLAEEGYDPAFGARPLSRVLDEKVKRPLTDALLFGELAAGGGRAVVDVTAGELTLRYEPRRRSGQG